MSCNIKNNPVHQGAVEGACVGFTKFCAALLSSSDAEIRDIPAHMLTQVSDDIFFSMRVFIQIPPQKNAFNFLKKFNLRV